MFTYRQLCVHCLSHCLWFSSLINRLIDWLIDKLLVADPFLRNMLLKCSITMVLTCPLLSRFKTSLSRKQVVFPFPFHIFLLLPNFWLIHLRGQIPILRTSCFDLYPLMCPLIRPLALGRSTILIPGFIRSPSTLADYGVAQSLPLWSAGRDFPFNMDETRKHLS